MFKKIFATIGFATSFALAPLAQAQDMVVSGVTFTSTAHVKLITWCLSQNCSVSGVAKDIYLLMNAKNTFRTISGVTTKGHRACFEENPGGKGISIRFDLIAEELKWAGCNGTGAFAFGL